MNGSLLRFYVHEGDCYGGRMLWEWLLDQANKHGVRGGSVFRAMAGFGRRELLALVHHEKLRLFYAHIPAHFGVIDPTATEPPSI